MYFNRSFLLRVGIIVLLGGVACSNPKEQNTSDTITLSDVKLESLEGETLDLTSFKGKIIFLNFWATWCRPCLQEMPTIEKAMIDLKEENIVFLFASDEDPDHILNFKNTRKFDFQYVRVLNLVELNIQALPTTFIFNENGHLIFSEMGYRDWSTEKNKTLLKPIPS